MKQQILVIDDSEKIHPLVKAILAEEPVTVQSATDPNYGMVLAASICPDLILLDVDMPDMDGFEVCRRLKMDPATAKCPVIFLTSHAEVKEKVRGFGLGAADYMTKPFNPAELVVRVRASLHTNRVIRLLEAKALIDPLTGLGNRTMFVQRLSAEICLRVRSNNPLSLTLIDVDDFAKLIETHGRSATEQLLEVVGRVLRDAYRLEDVVCHFGDGEFGVISPHTTGTEAVAFAQHRREILSGITLSPGAQSPSGLPRDGIRATASFGVADAVSSYDRSLIERADDALQRAKQLGPNRVCTALN